MLDFLHCGCAAFTAFRPESEKIDVLDDSRFEDLGIVNRKPISCTRNRTLSDIIQQDSCNSIDCVQVSTELCNLNFYTIKTFYQLYDLTENS